MEKGEIVPAVLFAMYGKEFTPMEALLEDYYNRTDKLGDAMKGQISLKPMRNNPARRKFPPKILKSLHSEYLEAREGICELFMLAVDSHNSDFIKELAKVVWFFRDKSRKSFAIDRETAALVILKNMCKMVRVKFTLRQIYRLANYDAVHTDKEIKIPADTLRSLRRRCHQLNIPIAPHKDKKANEKPFFVLNALIRKLLKSAA